MHLTDGQIAQLVEQGTENPCVSGSIPLLATIFILLISSTIESISHYFRWSVEHDKGEAVSGDIQMSEPRLLVTNKKSLDMRSSKRERN